MRYFTKELWLGAQQPDQDIDAMWNRAYEAYGEQLNKLEQKLSAETFSFFKEADIHDGELMQLQLKDGSRPAPLDKPKARWQCSFSFPVQASLQILDAYDVNLWVIEYSVIKRFSVDYPSEQPTFYRLGEGFGDVGYHELTDAGDDFFRHEILFSTGSSILIEAKNIHVKKLQARV